jgi:hypothetical protein
MKFRLSLHLTEDRTCSDDVTKCVRRRQGVSSLLLESRLGEPAEKSCEFPAASLISVAVLAQLGKGARLGSTLHIFSIHFSKIFILNELLASDRVESSQNLEPQELTGKIFQNKDLAWDLSLHTFSVGIPKILIPNGLGSLDRKRSWQNLEPQGLTAKIFQNKDLALGRKSVRESAGKNWLGEPARMERAWAFWNSQSRSSVTRSAIFVVEGCGIPVLGFSGPGLR